MAPSRLTAEDLSAPAAARSTAESLPSGMPIGFAAATPAKSLRGASATSSFVRAPRSHSGHRHAHLGLVDRPPAPATRRYRPATQPLPPRPPLAVSPAGFPAPEPHPRKPATSRGSSSLRYEFLRWRSSLWPRARREQPYGAASAVPRVREFRRSVSYLRLRTGLLIDVATADHVTHHTLRSETYRQPRHSCQRQCR